MTRTVRKRSRDTSVSCSYADRDEVRTAARVIHSPDAAGAKRRMWTLSVATLISITWLSSDLSGQVVQGRVVETGTDTPVALAGVFLLDAAREIVRSVLADSVGRFRITAPAAGEYYLLVQRLGYFETESHLVALSDGGDYAVDIEVRSEPIRLDPLLVTVRNEEMERWYTLALGVNPNSLRGFRVIQGARLAEARFKATDNTDLLRWLYIPVSHAQEVCLGSRMPEIDRTTLVVGEAACGRLYIDGVSVPAEHLDQLDKSEIAVVVLFPPNVEIFTFGFDWASRPARTR